MPARVFIAGSAANSWSRSIGQRNTIMYVGESNSPWPMVTVVVHPLLQPALCFREVLFRTLPVEPRGPGFTGPCLCGQVHAGVVHHPVILGVTAVHRARTECFTDLHPERIRQDIPRVR